MLKFFIQIADDTDKVLFTYAHAEVITTCAWLTFMKGPRIPKVTGVPAISIKAVGARGIGLIFQVFKIFPGRFPLPDITPT